VIGQSLSTASISVTIVCKPVSEFDDPNYSETTEVVLRTRFAQQAHYYSTSSIAGNESI